MVHEGADAAASYRPDPGHIHRNKLHLDLLAARAVQAQDRRRGRPSDQGHHIHAEVVEDQAGISHEGYEESTPARGKSGQDEPVRSWID